MTGHDGPEYPVVLAVAALWALSVVAQKRRAKSYIQAGLGLVVIATGLLFAYNMLRFIVG